jgi:hypothetical protein
MKLTLALIIPTILSLELSSPATPPGISGVHPIAAITSQDTETPVLSSQTLIEPGARVGPLKLGDSRDRALELFPKKNEDQEWNDKCGGGTTLDWVDSQNPTGHGDIYIRLNKKGKIFQIESSTTRFRTAEGITTFDHADKASRPPLSALARWSTGSTRRTVSPSSSLTIPRSTSATSTRSSCLSPIRIFARRKKAPPRPSGRPFLRMH